LGKQERIEFQHFFHKECELNVSILYGQVMSFAETVLIGPEHHNYIGQVLES
jgi:hypothetical protein